MKSALRLCALFSLLSSTGMLAAGTNLQNQTSQAPGSVRIEYVHPEKFTDFQLPSLDIQQTAAYFSNSLTRNLGSVLNKRAPGSTLVLQFTDVRLAGRFEPWRGPNFDRIRFYRDNTPVVLVFNYKLFDASGHLVTSGSDRVLDQNYLYTGIETVARASSSDQVYYERQAMKRWLVATIPSRGSGRES